MNHDKFFNQLSEYYDLPEDVIINLPIINMAGNQKMVIENHEGIVQYTDSQISIKIKKSLLIVEGVELKILQYAKDEIMIKGKIITIKFQ